jgi:SAM-dependent methyltransferase
MDAEVFRVHAEVERRHWWFVARRQILRAVVEALLPPSTSSRVVDLGCGVGATAPAFHPDYEYAGYEPSEVAVDFARSTYPGVTFHVGTAASASEDLARADVVLLTDVIEHVPDDRALLLEALQPMKAGAWLLVTVPAGMELWSPHDVALGHYRRYDVSSLRAVCSGMPARMGLLSYFNTRLYLPVRAARWMTSHLDRAAGHGGTDTLPPAPLNALLRRVFAGEGASLAEAINRSTAPGARGVSLMALLQRQPDSRAAT